MSLLQHIIKCGLTYTDEDECYTISPAPFTTISVVFDADEGNVTNVGDTLVLLNDIDEDGMFFDEFEEFSPNDDESAIKWFDYLYSQVFTEDVSSQLKRGVSAQKCLTNLNEIVGEERFQFQSL